MPSQSKGWSRQRGEESSASASKGEDREPLDKQVALGGLRGARRLPQLSPRVRVSIDVPVFSDGEFFFKFYC